MGVGERVSATVWEGLTKRVGLAGRSKPVSRTVGVGSVNYERTLMATANMQVTYYASCSSIPRISQWAHP